MIIQRIKFVLSVGILALSVVSHSSAETKPVSIEIEKSVSTVLISIDGLSNEQLRKYKPKNLTELAKTGLSTEALLPVYPTKTFPNHLSIVTGVYPSQHGIIHNKFYDVEKNQVYSMGAAGKDPSWMKAKPIWVLAEEQGVKAASYFWPESDAELFGVRPSYYFSYHHDTPNRDRTNQVIKWLELPESQKPKLITTYFSIVDSANHDFGSTSAEAIEAITEVDTIIGEFLTTLAAKNIEINLVIVSDHGMLDIDETIKLDSVIAPEVVVKLDKLVEGQTQIFINHKDSAYLNTVYQTLKNNAQGRYAVYLKSEFPAHWQLGKAVSNNYVPDLIVNANPGVIFQTKHYETAATHGYDLKDTDSMEAIFIANGVSIKQARLEKFQNIHVFALLAELAGIKLEGQPASLEVFKDVLK
ncbi:MAG: hypothetical protein CL811_03270 [Colwelliaceae bacterium]|nr:hypothetical protein [Colwelliaceae bacterium]